MKPNEKEHFQVELQQNQPSLDLVLSFWTGFSWSLVLVLNWFWFVFNIGFELV